MCAKRREPTCSIRQVFVPRHANVLHYISLRHIWLCPKARFEQARLKAESAKPWAIATAAVHRPRVCSGDPCPSLPTSSLAACGRRPDGGRVRVRGPGWYKIAQGHTRGNPNSCCTLSGRLTWTGAPQAHRGGRRRSIALAWAEVAGAAARYGTVHRAHRFPSSLGTCAFTALPLQNSSSAWDARSRSAKNVSSMRLARRRRRVLRAQGPMPGSRLPLGASESLSSSDAQDGAACISNQLPVRPPECWGLCQPPPHRETRIFNRRHNVTLRRIRASGLLVEGCRRGRTLSSGSVPASSPPANSVVKLSFCAAPRANHALRTVPPDPLARYTAAHDAAVWGTLQACLGATAEDEACPS